VRHASRQPPGWILGVHTSYVSCPLGARRLPPPPTLSTLTCPGCSARAVSSAPASLLPPPPPSLPPPAVSGGSPRGRVASSAARRACSASRRTRSWAACWSRTATNGAARTATALRSTWVAGAGCGVGEVTLERRRLWFSRAAGVGWVRRNGQGRPEHAALNGLGPPKSAPGRGSRRAPVSPAPRCQAQGARPPGRALLRRAGGRRC
jgi:hypothetical protein